MALSGLADLLAEIVPTLEVGPIELGISTFWFVPLTLVILFHGWWAALAAPVGELVFSDLVLGEFGGLGEFEEVVLVTIALYLACRLVKDPSNHRPSYLTQKLKEMTVGKPVKLEGDHFNITGVANDCHPTRSYND